MSNHLTYDQQKGNLLKEYDGFTRMAKRDPDLCVDLAAGVFGRLNGGDHNAAHADAETAVKTINMMARGQFGFAHAAKSVEAYFPLTDNRVEPADIDDLA